MAKLPIDLSGRKGLSNNNSQPVANNYSAENGSIVGGTFNPFIREGYLSPASGTVSTVAMDNTPVDMVSSLYDPENDHIWLLDSNGQLFKGTSTTDVALTREVDLAGTSLDTADYIVNGARKMFIAYRNGAGDADLAISNFPWDTGTDDLTWLTATVTGQFSNDLALNDDVILVPADNGFMYMCMINQIHKIDGTSGGGASGTTTANVVVFPNNFSIVDAVDYRGSLFAAVHQYTKHTRVSTIALLKGNPPVGVIIWNRRSTVVGLDDYIPIPDAKAIHSLYISPNANLRAIVTTSSGMVEIKEFTGSSFRTIQQVTYGDYPVRRKSVQVMGNMTYFMSKLGVLYAHGSLSPGKPEGLYKIYTAATPHATNGSSVILPIGGDTTVPPAMYFDYFTAGSARAVRRLAIQTFAGQYSSENAGAGNVFTPVFDLPLMSTVKYIDVYTYKSVNATSDEMGQVKVYFNNSSSAFKTESVTEAKLNRGYFRIELNKAFVDSIQLEIIADTGETMGTDDFAPSIAVVDYEPTGAKG